MESAPLVCRSGRCLLSIFIFAWVQLEHLLLFAAGEQISHALICRREFGNTFDRLAHFGEANRALSIERQVSIDIFFFVVSEHAFGLLIREQVQVTIVQRRVLDGPGNSTVHFDLSDDAVTTQNWCVLFWSPHEHLFFFFAWKKVRLSIEFDWIA